MFKLYDTVRIDHFRGFDSYYAIPAKDKTAKNGEWRKGPGRHLTKVIRKATKGSDIIAEDLGFLTPSVLKLVKKTGYPGMKVLQFAFDSREESDYLPHNYTKNCVVYTGTHDNDTTEGWFTALSAKDRRFCRNYLDMKGRGQGKIHTAMIRTALASVADTAIIPMQDYLGLDSRARINTPSTLGNNWKWRMKADAFTGELAEEIRKITKLYGRL